VTTTADVLAAQAIVRAFKGTEVEPPADVVELAALDPYDQAAGQPLHADFKWAFQGRHDTTDTELSVAPLQPDWSSVDWVIGKVALPTLEATREPGVGTLGWMAVPVSEATTAEVSDAE
jgi:hypothetical protein